MQDCIVKASFLKTNKQKENHRSWYFRTITLYADFYSYSYKHVSSYTNLGWPYLYYCTKSNASEDWIIIAVSSDINLGTKSAV